MSVNDPMRWSIWSDLLLFLDEKKFNPLYIFLKQSYHRDYSAKILKKKTAGRSLTCSLEAGGNTLCIHQWLHEFLFWNVLLSSSAGVRCQPVRAGCQNTKWGMGRYTSKGRGRHGSLPEKHAVQRMNFEETGSHQKSPCVLHSPSARGHFTFHWQLLSANLSPISWRTTPSPSLLLPKPLSSPIPAKRNSSQPETDFQGATRAAHLRVRLPWDQRTWRCKAALLGKAQSPCSTSTFHPFGLSQGLSEKTFFFPRFLFFGFLSVQIRTMNSSSPQECDKVSTKPTRKVMYGPWAAAPINHFTNQSCKEWALQAECRGPAPCTLKQAHTTPSLSQCPHWSAPVTPAPTNWPAQGWSSFPSVANTVRTWGVLYNLMCFRDMRWCGFVEGCLESSTQNPNFKGL